MKNEKLLKILGITILAVILLTWVIPASNFNGYEIAKGQITPVGLWDIFSVIGIAIAYFWQTGIFLLFVGGFYGVIDQTGLLKKLIDNIKKEFKGKEKIFLVISILFFAIISSLTGIYLPLFIFVPLFIGVIIAMGYNKIIAMLCTIGSIIIGSISLIYNDFVYTTLNITGAPNLWYKLALILTTLGITIFYVLKTANIAKGRKAEKVSEVIMFADDTEEKSKSYKLWPLITGLSSLLIIFILGMTRWNQIFNLDIFNKIHESIMNVKIGNFYIFQNILGQTIMPLGQWGITELFVIIALVILFIGLMYKLNIKNILTSFMNGATKLFPVAVIVVLINIVVVFTLNSGFYTTVMNFILNLTQNTNIILLAINSFLGNILVIDNLYIANYIISITSRIVSADTSVTLLSLTNQTMYGIAMLIAPTSLALIAGLSYLNISYVDWIKYIWRLLLMLLVIIFIVLIVATIL